MGSRPQPDASIPGLLASLPRPPRPSAPDRTELDHNPHSQRLQAVQALKAVGLQALDSVVMKMPVWEGKTGQPGARSTEPGGGGKGQTAA